jgi:hypothetical protein
LKIDTSIYYTKVFLWLYIHAERLWRRFSKIYSVDNNIIKVPDFVSFFCLHPKRIWRNLYK